MKKIRLSIVIPVYNEKESIDELITKTEKALPNSSWPKEYVVVDDGSTDGSLALLKRIKSSLATPFTIIRFRKNSGKSMALSEGFKRAIGDTIVTMDADLQDDPAELPKMLRLLSRGYDVVVGWRKKRIDHQSKLGLSFIFNRVVSAITRVDLHDMNCGMKVMRKNVTEEIDVYGELHRYIPVLAAAQGFKVTEIEVTHHARKFGVSKFGFGRVMRAPFDLMTTLFLTKFKSKPLQIFGPIGMSSIVIGLVQLIYLSVLHFMGQSIGRRPLLFSGILFVLFGVQLVSTGLIGELITKSHIRSEKHPVEEIII